MEAGYWQQWLIPVHHILHCRVFPKQKGLAVGSIKGRFSAVAFASKSLGYTECTGNFRVWRMLGGWRREESSCQDLHQALFPKVLKGLQAA